MIKYNYCYIFFFKCQICNRIKNLHYQNFWGSTLYYFDIYIYIMFRTSDIPGKNNTTLP